MLGYITFLSQKQNVQNLKDKKFIWAYSFQGFSAWLVSSKTEIAWWKGITKRSCSLHGSQEADRAERIQQGR